MNKAKNQYLLFFGIAILSLIFVFWKFIFLNHYLLYEDISNDALYQVYPYIKAINGLSLKEKFLSWSFAFGPGQLVSGIYIGNIFNWPLFFINPLFIQKGITLMEVLKLLLTGLIFFEYLKNKAYHPSISIFGGVLVMLSGYLMINASWFNYFSYVGFLWVFWLFSLEKMIKGNFLYLTIAIFLTAIDQTYNLYHFGIYSLVYFFIHKSDISNWGDLSKKISLASLIGLLTSSVFLASNIDSIINSPRFDMHYSYFNQLFNSETLKIISFGEAKTSFFRFFSNNIEGIGYNFSGPSIYVEAPMFFMAGFSLLLIGQHFINEKKKLNLKASVLFVLIFAFLIFPFLRYSFWLFSADYYRDLAFAIALLVFESSLNTLNKIYTKNKSLNLPILVSNFLIIATLFILFEQCSTPFFKKSFFLIIVYTGLLIATIKSKNKITLYFILGIATLDSIYEAYFTINNRPVVTAMEDKLRKGFNDYSIEAINWLKSIDDSFYRIEKDYSSGSAPIVLSLNDAMVQGYNGIRVHTSFNNLHYIKYLKNMENLKFDTENDTRWVFAATDRLEMLDNLSVKYMLSKGGFDWTKAGFEFLKKIENVSIYRNPNHKPMGSVFSNVITESDFDKLALSKKRSLMKDYIVVKDDNLNEIINISKTSPSIHSIENPDKFLKVSSYSNNHFEGSISIKDASILYFSILNDPGWRVHIDGIETKKIMANYGMTAVVLKPGNHKITLHYKMSFFNILVCLSIFGTSIIFYLLILSKYEK